MPSQERRRKHGRKPLVRGAVRVLGLHDGLDGRTFRVGYDALAETFGPLSTRLLRLEASRAAAAWTRLVAAQRSLAAARRERERGKGRRPSVRELERLSRRVGLDDASYTAAVDRLADLARTGRPPSDRLADVRRAVAEANR
jgi:hypothetical protein